jgi:hypothetical protein
MEHEKIKFSNGDGKIELLSMLLDNFELIQYERSAYYPKIVEKEDELIIEMGDYIRPLRINFLGYWCKKCEDWVKHPNEGNCSLKELLTHLVVEHMCE